MVRSKFFSNFFINFVKFYKKNNAVFCYYTGFWYCLDCIAVEERVIPYKAIEEFDFNEYRVSKESRDEIDLLYDKFLINMPYTSPLLSKHQEFYEFMVIFIIIIFFLFFL